MSEMWEVRSDERPGGSVYCACHAKGSRDVISGE